MRLGEVVKLVHQMEKHGCTDSSYNYNQNAFENFIISANNLEFSVDLGKINQVFTTM